MSAAAAELAKNGLEVVDIESDPAYARRSLHVRDVNLQMQGMHRISHAFLQSPNTILQELVTAAVELCGADSAGISIERQDATDQEFYRWVATAGQYSGFLDAILPRTPSACGICLERGRPQLFRVTQPFFDILQVSAPLVTDGILLPWSVEGMRGTIFVMAHGRTEAFDLQDCRMMQMLADFAATGVRQQRQQEMLLARTANEAAVSMANDLAHKINNPLQGLTNILYLTAQGHVGEEARAMGQLALGDLERLSTLVRELLALPFRGAAV